MRTRHLASYPRREYSTVELTMLVLVLDRVGLGRAPDMPWIQKIGCIGFTWLCVVASGENSIFVSSREETEDEGGCQRGEAEPYKPRGADGPIDPRGANAGVSVSAGDGVDVDAMTRVSKL